MKPAIEPQQPGRIVSAIKVYRHQTADYRDPMTNELVNTWLKQHLSTEEWALWQRLRTNSQRTFQPNTVVHA